jgi:ABC-2 type transport system ATP-binding protein
LRKQAQNKEIVRVIIEEGNRDEIIRGLQGIETVELVDPLPDHTHAFEVQSRPGAGSRKAIFRLCVDKGWYLTEMTPVERKLEEIFRDLTVAN